MEEFRVIVRIKNNILLKLRENAGLPAWKLSEKIGISLNTYYRYESLKASPLDFRGGNKNTWNKSALKISDYWRVLPDDIWPEAVLNVKNSKVEKCIGAESIDLLIGQETKRLTDGSYQDYENAGVVSEYLERLPPRKQQILSMLYGLNEQEHQYSALEIGKIMNVGRAQVYQLINQCMGILRDTKHQPNSIKIDENREQSARPSQYKG